MAKRYRFRKVHVICEDNLVFDEVVTNTIYRDRSYALEVCNNQQHNAISESIKAYNNGKPIPQYRVHGFYLVHENLFDELLKQHSKK